MVSRFPKPGIIAWLLLLSTLTGCTKKSGTGIVFREKADLPPVVCKADSITLPFLFYSERWFLSQGDLYVLNSRAAPFLTVYSLPERRVRVQWGNIGRGPHEVPIPSLGEMRDKNRVAIYSNSLNQIELFELRADNLAYLSTFHFPIWIKRQRSPPKPYTRLVQYNDTLFVGTSFLPRQIAVELLDIQNEQIIDVVDFQLQPTEGGYSAPFECKAALGADRMVVAYRYINRIELYDLSPEGFRLTHVLGSGATQEELYAQERDNEMYFYYSDVVCGQRCVYALWQGVPTGDLGKKASCIEIIDIENGETRCILSSDRYLTDIVVDEKNGVIYGHDPLNEDCLYVYRIPV